MERQRLIRTPIKARWPAKVIEHRVLKLESKFEAKERHTFFVDYFSQYLRCLQVECAIVATGSGLRLSECREKDKERDILTPELITRRTTLR